MGIEVTIGDNMEKISAKYFDSENEHCVLIRTTFTDFLRTARPDGDGISLLKLDLVPHKSSPRADIFTFKGDGSETLLEQRHNGDELSVLERTYVEVEDVDDNGCGFE